MYRDEQKTNACWQNDVSNLFLYFADTLGTQKEPISQLPGRCGSATKNPRLLSLRFGPPSLRCFSRYLTALFGRQLAFSGCTAQPAQMNRVWVFFFFFLLIPSEFWRPWHSISKSAVFWTWEKPSSMGASRPLKRGLRVGKTKCGKGTKIMAVADRHGLPVAVFVESATPHEVKLAFPTLTQMVIPEAPQNLIGDKPYDSDTLDVELCRYGIELIAPHRNLQCPARLKRIIGREP